MRVFRTDKRPSGWRVDGEDKVEWVKLDLEEPCGHVEVFRFHLERIEQPSEVFKQGGLVVSSWEKNQVASRGVNGL